MSKNPNPSAISAYDMDDGYVTIPDAPGWGAEIEPLWLENTSYEISELK